MMNAQTIIMPPSRTELQIDISFSSINKGCFKNDQCLKVTWFLVTDVAEWTLSGGSWILRDKLSLFKILAAKGGQILGIKRAIGQRNAMIMCPK